MTDEATELVSLWLLGWHQPCCITSSALVRAVVNSASLFLTSKQTSDSDVLQTLTFAVGRELYVQVSWCAFRLVVLVSFATW